MKTPTTLRRTLRAGLLAAAVTAVLGGAAMAPAMADDWHHGDRDRSAHDRRDRDDWRDHDRFDHRPAVYGYGYAYPPGYGYGYAPAPAPALNLGFVFR